MSNSRVIIAVAVAVLLAMAAIVFLRPAPGGAGAGAPTQRSAALGFDPARTTEVSVAILDEKGQTQRTERVVRTSAGAWEVRWTGADGQMQTWPAAPAQVRAALRILSTTEARPAERGTRLESPAARVEIRQEDGSTHLLHLSARALAGQVLAEAGTPGNLRTVWLERMVLDLLISSSAITGPRAWRDPSALPGAGVDVARATLQGTAGTLSVGRVRGRWAVREPVSDFAEPDAISKLFSSLANVRIVDYLDIGPPAQTGLDAPIAVLTLESDLREEASGSPAAVVRHTLEVGHTADLAGTNVFARVRREVQDGQGRAVELDRIIIVSGEALAAIAMDPATYISRRALQHPPGDIGVLSVRIGSTSVNYERTLDGWRRETGNGGRSAAERREEDGINALLSMLTQVPASAVAVAQGQAPIAAEIELKSLGGLPLGEVRIVQDSVGNVLATVSGAVRREYDTRANQAVIQWLSVLAQ